MAYFVFGDESGGLANREDRYVAIAAVGGTQVRNFDKIVGLVRDWLQQRGKRFHNVGELRFHNAEEETRVKLLGLLAHTEIDIYICVFEKHARLIDDTPENYARMLFPIVKEIVRHHANAHFAFDKHFSKPNQRAHVKSILEELAGQSLEIRSEDSQRNPGIQVADFVAGAALAKYQREEDKYLEVVRERIVIERWVQWDEMKKW